ncbi:uncharacterized protein LOC111829455 [Capsella rubella]|uniref:uncharacterized protein LOC111829455 n=1 Tax=Capsella rubella TaxID=81985 RepID=UPI000CD49C3D|nr:uncharacterized protein LOC111829455 [Capsella rubella]
MRVGDMNSKYFHAQTKCRRARNRIVGLFNTQDIWCSEDKDIYGIATDYFNELFSTSNPSAFEEALGGIQTLISEEENRSLTQAVTEKEIKDALFMMNPEKAPGPDGMTALFFQQAWGVVKEDLVFVVNSFFQDGVFDKRLNRTNICLIPKVERPTRMAEFRPISLCNVSYKVISKVLCQRLKQVLPGLISETQSAFVPGRLISDNILIAQEMFHGLRTNQACKNKFMAIKTDMSKAYDRVEWEFVERLLRKFGFSEKWISWVMFCVSSVEYNVLINGQPQGSIIPERGLRQGDPLSPYIFILCTEVLIANIRRAEGAKQISGIKVANKSPPISHLLFADDSLFFCKANKEQGAVILDILKRYELVSGQQINFAKSSIQFGHKVDEVTKTEIQGVLGITTMGGMGTYLGLPESIGGPKTKVFSFVQDRLNNHISGWSAKLLSKGGKEVMIKAVASALPTYVMSCFRLPKSVTTKLTSAVANFWWGSNGGAGGMHWWAWAKLCDSKQLGGLGFRDVQDFNSALLAKQLWRLMEFPDSLFAKVFKSRYYRKSDPMAQIRTYSPSYGWRSIISARSLVQKGLIKRVGSGEAISIWTDPWIPAQFPRPASSIGPFKDPTLLLTQFIDRQRNMWRMELLKQFFDPSDVSLINAIPVGNYAEKDALGWHFTKHGKYTVKSGYHTARLVTSEGFKPVVCGPLLTPLFAKIWKVRCPRKIQHFMWQLLSGCISVAANLRRRGINIDPSCSRCGSPLETVNHAIFECPPARQSWALANISTGPNFFPTESVYANMAYLLEPDIQNSGDGSFPWILWYIWKARNTKVFENMDDCPADVIKLAKDEATTWQRAQLEGLGQGTGNGVGGLRNLGETRVLNIDVDGTCCFVDGSWKNTDPYAGLGWYCPQTQDVPTTMGAQTIRRSMSPLHAEVEALVWAMRCMIGHNFTEVKFYTDCSDLVKMVSSPCEWPVFSAYLADIQVDREEFESFSLSLISRNANVKADSLARRARVNPHIAKFVNNVPSDWLI